MNHLFFLLIFSVFSVMSNVSNNLFANNYIDTLPNTDLPKGSYPKTNQDALIGYDSDQPKKGTLQSLLKNESKSFNSTTLENSSSNINQRLGKSFENRKKKNIPFYLYPKVESTTARARVIKRKDKNIKSIIAEDLVMLETKHEVVGFLCRKNWQILKEEVSVGGTLSIGLQPDKLYKIKGPDNQFIISRASKLVINGSKDKEIRITIYECPNKEIFQNRNLLEKSGKVQRKNKL